MQFVDKYFENEEPVIWIKKDGKSIPCKFEVSTEPFADSPQRIAFKEFMCRKFNVQSVDDLPMSNKEYADWMDCWEEAISFRDQEILENMLKKSDDNQSVRETQEFLNFLKEKSDD